MSPDAVDERGGTVDRRGSAEFAGLAGREAPDGADGRQGSSGREADVSADTDVTTGLVLRPRADASAGADRSRKLNSVLVLAVRQELTMDSSKRQRTTPEESLRSKATATLLVLFASDTLCRRQGTGRDEET